MLSEGRFQCPCCDFYTLEQRGAYDVCPVCYWEDDGQDLDRVDEVSAPNHITLRQARRNFVRYGACDQSAVSLVVTRDELVGLRRELRDS